MSTHGVVLHDVMGIIQTSILQLTYSPTLMFVHRSSVLIKYIIRSNCVMILSKRSLVSSSTL